MEVELNRATRATEDVKETISEMFAYLPWDEEKTARSKTVRYALENAVSVIIDNVPPAPDRTVAIRKIREARMDCNSAITHGGKY